MIKHCPTCTCGAADEPARAADAWPETWQRYSRTTTGPRECARCHVETVMPGRDGWVWRNVGTRGRRRSSESRCKPCQIFFANLEVQREK